MTNKHTFTSELGENKLFESDVNNSHSFTSYLSASKLYGLVIEGYKATTSWFVRMDQQLDFKTSLVKLKQRFFVTMESISSMDVALPKLKQRLSIAMDFVNVLEVLSMKMNQRMGLISFSNRLDFSTVMRQEIKVSNIRMMDSSLTMQAVPIVTRAYLVSDWDSSLLSVLDSNTLQEMDYQIV